MYGSWKDIKLILEILQDEKKKVSSVFRKTERQIQLENLETALFYLFQSALEKDLDHLKALKIQESKTRKRLKRILESKKVLLRKLSK